MANVSTIASIVATSATINAFAAVRKGDTEKTFQVVFANVALFAGLTAIGQFVDWSLAAALAGVNLLHTLLVDGVPFINWFSALVKGN